MRVLFLGPCRENFIEFFQSFGDEVMTTEGPLTVEDVRSWAPDFLVSYGYRHILNENILDLFPGRAINLHISLLPWNRGADPNLWSYLEDTPRGVSIHFLSTGIDTGDLLAQIVVDDNSEDTLRSSYERLSSTIESLFFSSWPAIKDGMIQGVPQPPGGSYHRARDREKFSFLLSEGWDTPVSTILGAALKNNH